MGCGCALHPHKSGATTSGTCICPTQRSYCRSRTALRARFGPSALRTTYYGVGGPSDLPLAVHRLRSSRPQFPLRSPGVSELCLAPSLFSALRATTSLERFDLHIVRGLPPSRDETARLISQLKEVESLRAACLHYFPPEAGLALLQSRTNWTHYSRVESGCRCLRVSAAQSL